MAHNKINVLLGYEDEQITDKYQSLVNFTTNKFGGKPNYPSAVRIDAPTCPLCLLPQLLIVQIYAPIESVTYHRTLYVFACLNAHCWNNSKSWCCLRTQTLEQVAQPSEYEQISDNVVATPAPTSRKVTDWCVDADDWDDDSINCNVSEENGNIVADHRISDEDDEESCSLEESLLARGMDQMSVDDRNANWGSSQEALGAVGRLHSPSATAEIECNEGDVVSIDSPIRPQTDIAALLVDTTTPLPSTPTAKAMQFVPYFISVADASYDTQQLISENHIRDLMQRYEASEEGGQQSPEAEGAAGGGDICVEKYEDEMPAHGDKMFHRFFMRIRENPGQILRYSRESNNQLLLYPELSERTLKCQHCSGDMVFEFQILPTIISRLRIDNDATTADSGGGDSSGIGFGNAMIYTCRKSCWTTDSNVHTEHVIVQREL